MEVAILGYGVEGRASAQYWNNLGHNVTVCERDENALIPPEYARQLGSSHLKSLHKFDLLVRSSGLHPSKIHEANPGYPILADKITTGINEFLRVCPTTKVIGVTGTKGKGTTSTLAAKLLGAAGKKAHLGGNIGVAALELLPKVKSADWVVLELSSFQLFDLKHRIPIGVCLSVTPEHLNWHQDLNDYQRAKANLFRLQSREDLAIYNQRSEVAREIVSVSPGAKVAYDVPPIGEEPQSTTGAYVKGGQIYYHDQAIIEVERVALPGRHNLENICASLTAVWPGLGGDIAAVQKVLMSFKGLEEHLELIAEVGGVKYYNDTYATAPDAAIAAMNAFTEPKVMILGGIDKQVPLDEMVDAIIASNVRGVVLIDDLAEQLSDLFAKKKFVNAVRGGSTTREIVVKAQALARPGDVVLLSPGCAGNGGMFIDKIDRGHQFNAAVLKLR